MRSVWRWVMIVVIVLGLSACGGGSSGGKNGNNPSNTNNDNNKKQTKMPMVPYVPAAGYSGKVYYLHGQEQKVYFTSSYGDDVDFSVNDSDLPVEGNIMTIPDDVRGDKRITVHASKDGVSGDINVTLRGLTPILLIDEEITAETRLLTDPYGIYKIQIDEEASIPDGTHLKVYAARKDDGLWLYRYDSDYDFESNDLDIQKPVSIEMDNVYGGLVEKVEPLNKSKKYLGKGRQLSVHYYTTDSGKEVTNKCKNTYTPIPVGTYVGEYWSTPWWGKMMIGVPEDTRFHRADKHTITEYSGLLCGQYNWKDVKGKVPILFVHGYAQGSDFGGGSKDSDSTWYNFPAYLKTGDRALYEFRWRTNARFQDAAGDLCQAINTIYASTGRMIHIVAHSFGGVLTRTYLQGLAHCKNNRDLVPVASLTTIGSPHSGLDKDWGGGYDTDTAGVVGGIACRQQTCYQMGDNVVTVRYDLFAKKNIIPRQLSERNFRKNLLRDKIPVQVLMGSVNSSKGYGDGLISQNGQRFNTLWDGEYSNKSLNNALVTQHILSGTYWHNSSSRSLSLRKNNYPNGNLEVAASSEQETVKLAEEWIVTHPTKISNSHRIYFDIKVLDPDGHQIDFEIEDTEEKIMLQNGIDGYGYKSKIYSFPLKKSGGRYLFLGKNVKVHTRDKMLLSEDFMLSVKTEADIRGYGDSVDNPIRKEFQLKKKFIPPAKEKQVKSTVINLKEIGNPLLTNVIKNKIDDNIYEVTLQGNNFDTHTLVTVGSFDDDLRRPVSIKDMTSTQIRLQQGSAPGYQQICVQKMVSGAVSAASCKDLVFEKIKDDSLKIETLRPGYLMGSETPQRVTISGVGFTLKSKVHYRTSSGSHGVFRSGKYVDNNTMYFDIITDFASTTWKIWVENPMQKSDYVTLNVDISNKPDPTVHRPSVPIPLKPGGYKYAVDRILNGYTVFTWEASAGAQRYRVCYYKVDGDPNIDKPTCHNNIDGTKTSTAFNLKMEPDTLYAWRVSACESKADDKTCSDWSPNGKPLFMLSKAKDTAPPEIDINGDNPLTLTIGEEFNDPGASAFDYEENQVITVTISRNTVDTAQAGNYEVVYEATDSSGNTGKAIRVVKVTEDSSDTNTATSKLKKTGQNKSYDEDGNEVTDYSFKDDGYYQAGVDPNYTRDPNTGIVTDHVTRLEWQDNIDPVVKQWLTDDNYNKCTGQNGETRDESACYNTGGDTAVTYCTNLDLNGRGWRLPTVQELEGIVDYGQYDPAIKSNVFEHMTSAYYVSSTTTHNSTNNVWIVSLSSGHRFCMNTGTRKNNSFRTRCVRDK